MSEHQLAAFIAGLSAAGSGVLEAANYFGGWGAPPGTATAVVMTFGGAYAGSVEIGAAAAKGYEKLKGLMTRNPRTGAEGQQQSQTAIGGNKT